MTIDTVYSYDEKVMAAWAAEDAARVALRLAKLAFKKAEAEAFEAEIEALLRAGTTLGETK